MTRSIPPSKNFAKIRSKLFLVIKCFLLKAFECSMSGYVTNRGLDGWFKSYLSDRLFCVKCSHDLIEPHQSCYAVPQGMYSDLCFSHCTPLLSVLLFPHSHSVTICMLMTPSCSYHSSPPSSMKIFLACKLLLVPSLTG